MSKLKDFVNKGVRLIVTDDAAQSEPAEAETHATRSAPSRTPRELPAELVDAEPPKSVERSQLAADVADFAAVYAEAAIELPLHGYGVDKVGEMLENKRLATMTREVRASAVLAALEAAGVELKDVIQDAVRRDKALDAFLAGKAAEVQELRAQSEARVQAIQEEIQALLRTKNAEIEALKSGAETAARALRALEEKKHKEEERLFTIVGHFAEGAENPVTRSAAPAPEKPAKAT
jgi:hypothetical protein